MDSNIITRKKAGNNPVYCAYRRKKDDSTFSLAHLTGMLIIFR